eukprot:280500-Lingulodinium_polyedra.AAC.1
MLLLGHHGARSSARRVAGCSSGLAASLRPRCDRGHGRCSSRGRPSAVLTSAARAGAASSRLM